VILTLQQLFFTALEEGQSKPEQNLEQMHKSFYTLEMSITVCAVEKGPTSTLLGHWKSKTFNA